MPSPLEKEIERRHHGLHRLVVKVSDRSREAPTLRHSLGPPVNETLANRTLLETLLGHSLDTPLDIDIAEDPDLALQAAWQASSLSVVAGVVAVALLIALAVLVRYTATGGQEWLPRLARRRPRTCALKPSSKVSKGAAKARAREQSLPSP